MVVPQIQLCNSNKIIVIEVFKKMANLPLLLKAKNFKKSNVFNRAISIFADDILRTPCI